MKVYYNEFNKNWSHEQPELELSFGANNTIIPFQNHAHTTDIICLDLEPFHPNQILTIGILTNKNQKKFEEISGNLSLFRSLQTYLLEHGILSYVLTIEDVLNHENCGYIYSSKLRKWQKIAVPLPQIVYNRIPSRAVESSPSFQKIKDQFSNNHIIMFNPSFIDKYEMYATFKQHEKLKPLLPQTRIITNFTSFIEFFLIHKAIYLKPREGNRGNGIYTLTQKKDGSLQLKSPNHDESFPSLTAYWTMYEKQLHAKNYIAQQAILPKKKNGHRYDYRLLVHYENGLFKITGKAVRMAYIQEITTHVPRGGKIYPYNKVSTESVDQQLAEIAQTCGTVLSEQLGFIGEFSIDLGESETGELFIYEVNSKPMQFDEVDIEANRLLHLKKLFIELTSQKQ